MEFELKLLLDPALRSVVEGHPIFAEAEATSETRREVTTYFDTPDFDLRRHGATLRVRQSGSRYVQTVKLNRAEGVIGGRGEWEWAVASLDVDSEKLASLPEDAAFVRRFEDRVRPVFDSEITRKVWRLSLDDSTAVEAVIDEGCVRAGPRRAEICEVELELKQGSPAPLFRLAIDLADRASLRYGPQSKAERGYGLVADDLPPEPHAARPALHRKATLGEAFPRLVNAALRDLAAEIPAAANRNVEGVHRMRAAIRKLRTLFVLFAPYLDRAAAERFNAVLRDIGRVLGRGRDWDVLLTETLPDAEAKLEGRGIDLLVPPATIRSAEAHGAVSEALGGPLATGLILGLGAWTTDPAWLRGTEPDARLSDVIPHLLTRLERKVAKRARHLGPAGPDVAAEDLHALRKALKKLRYSVEDVGGMFKRGEVHRYLRSIKAALSALGEINDASVTVALVGEVATTDRPELAPSAALLLAWNARRHAKASAKLEGKLDKFFRHKSFWT